jgi:hypothetical protein
VSAQPKNPQTMKVGLPLLAVGVLSIYTGVAIGWGCLIGGLGLLLIITGGD